MKRSLEPLKSDGDAARNGRAIASAQRRRQIDCDGPDLAPVRSAPAGRGRGVRETGDNAGRPRREQRARAQRERDS